MHEQNGGSAEHAAADQDHTPVPDDTDWPTNCDRCGLAVNARGTHHFPADVDER